MLSIIIPLRNEYENLDEIERQFSTSLSQISHEVVLINDYSTDNTFLKAQKCMRFSRSGSEDVQLVPRTFTSA